MLKNLAIFGMLLVVFSAVGRANQIPAKENHQKPTAPVSTVPPQQREGVALRDRDQKDIHADAKIIDPPQKDFYDKAPVWISLALVAVALGTGIVIGWQSMETRKAAQATLTSVRLQEVQYKQWVEVGLWENKSPHIQPNATEATLTLKFEVGNATDYPLTLKKLTTERDGGSSSYSMNYSIAPDDSYLAFYSFDASTAELQLYRQNKMEVKLSIEAEIRDVLERDNPPQRFTHTITFGPTKCDAIDQPGHFQIRIKQIG